MIYSENQSHDGKMRLERHFQVGNDMCELTSVHLESSTACNAKCKMCPHPQITRRGMMDYGLFRSIVDQAMNLGCVRFTPFRMGEPLLFPGLFDWLDYFREKGAITSIYTNASRLTPEIGDRLKEYADLFFDFTISFYGYDQESYESMMGLDFQKVTERITAFMEDNPIGVGIYTATNDPSDTEFGEKFHSLWDGMGFSSVGIVRFGEWPGSIEGYVTPRTLAEEGANFEIRPCPRVLQELDVMYDGTACLCCVDAHGEITFGNLNDLTVEQALEHKLRKYYQAKHLARESDELPLCKQCSVNITLL